MQGLYFNENLTKLKLVRLFERDEPWNIKFSKQQTIKTALEKNRFYTLKNNTLQKLNF